MIGKMSQIYLELDSWRRFYLPKLKRKLKFFPERFSRLAYFMEIETSLINEIFY